MNIDKNDLQRLLNDSSPTRQWKEDEVSDKMVADFNKEYASFSKVYPSYDIFDTSDYRGKQDDEFLQLIDKVLVENGQKKIFESEDQGISGKTLVEDDGWPEEYEGKNYASEECEQALDEQFAAQSWEATKAIVSQIPLKAVQIAVSRNMGWKQFKTDIKPYISRVAAFCLGPSLDGDLQCWKSRTDGIAQNVVRNILIKDLRDYSQVCESIMRELVAKYPMNFNIRKAMRYEVMPNLHLRVINESSLELDADEFADIAAALNATAQNLANIVHGFVSKAIAKAKEITGKGADEAKKDDGGADGNTYTDNSQDILFNYEECLKGGMNPEEAIVAVAAAFKLSDSKIRETLTSLNVNIEAAATTAAKNNAAAPAPGNSAVDTTVQAKGAPIDDKARLGAEKIRLSKLHQDNPGDEKITKDLNDVLAALGEEPVKETVEEPAQNPFALHVNKQYQTASGQVLTLRKMTSGVNPQLIFEDESTGEKIELLQDKFALMNPVETNIDSTKSRRALINKFKKRINLSTMKHTARIIFKNRKGHKIYENLDSIKSGGKPVGDIAGVVIGTNGKDGNQIEYVVGDKVKAGDIKGMIKSFSMNEADEPEIIVKTPDGDEVTITVADFEDAAPVHMDDPLEEDPSLVGEHLEYKGYSLLQNAEDDTWSVMKGDTKVEDAPVGTEEDAKAWIDAKLEEEGGAPAGDDTPVDDDSANESISRRFITESKSGQIRLKTFSQVLEETRTVGLRENLVNKSTKRPISKRPMQSFKKKAQIREANENIALITFVGKSRDDGEEKGIKFAFTKPLDKKVFASMKSQANLKGVFPPNFTEAEEEPWNEEGLEKGLDEIVEELKSKPFVKVLEDYL